MSKTESKNIIERSPIVVVMGHIDHGKSTLLDFIRKSNVVEGEAGSITQHMTAYEIIHKDNKRITFIDTPGHSAFSAMRSRGANIADIAILIISAEDGVKPQTIEAYESIKNAKIPFIVAINKIDKPNANIEKVKQELIGNEIYLEGYGGDISFVPISAKKGDGVPELLDMLLLVAEIEELKGDTSLLGQGFILESKMDPKKGVETMAIIKDGTVKKGDFILVGNQVGPIRRLEDFLGNPIDSAFFSSPVRIIGCCDVPEVGLPFSIYSNKKEANEALLNREESPIIETENIEDDGIDKTEILVIIKADVSGTIEAIKQEIGKIENERAIIRFIHEGVGDISENDIKLAGRKENVLIIGFNTRINQNIKNLAEQSGIKIASFDVIYKLTEWLEENIKNLIPKIKIEESIGKAKIIRLFSKTKDEQIIGGKVKEGKITLGSEVKILRRDYEIGRGTLINLEKQKIKSQEVLEGEEFGMNLKSKIDISEGDYIEAFIVVEK